MCERFQRNRIDHASIPSTADVVARTFDDRATSLSSRCRSHRCADLLCCVWPQPFLASGLPQYSRRRRGPQVSAARRAPAARVVVASAAASSACSHSHKVDYVRAADPGAASARSRRPLTTTIMSGGRLTIPRAALWFLASDEKNPGTTPPFSRLF
jgi:hypothetical protein